MPNDFISELFISDSSERMFKRKKWKEVNSRSRGNRQSKMALRKQGQGRSWLGE